MRPAGPLDVAPGQTVAVQPGEGGLHVMLMHMTRALKAGDHFPLTLTFEKGGAVTAEATVGTHPPGGKMRSMPGMGH
jgi:copper(I)-binding protein